MNSERQNNKPEDSGELDDFYDNEDDYCDIEFDETLYSPSIQQNTRLDVSKKVFDPSSFPFFGLFISLFMLIPVAYNLFRFRQWRLLAGSIILLDEAATPQES